MATQAEDSGDDGMLRMPLVHEELSVGRRSVETGQGIRVHKTVSEETWRVDDAVLRQQLAIEHVPVNAWIEGELPVQRHEGATLVIPVLEEVLVVQKRVRLKEEIRITAHTRSEPVSSTVVLRTEHASVQRFDELQNTPADAHAAVSEGGQAVPQEGRHSRRHAEQQTDPHADAAAPPPRVPPH